MNKIINLSVDNRFFVFLVTLIVCAYGYYSFTVLPIDAVPDITNTQVQINTKVSGLVPEEIERMVTFPIEFSMNGIPKVERVRSLSRFGISQVTVVFKEGVDIYRARQLVSEKLGQISLPQGFTPQMGPLSTGLGEIFHYSVEAKTPEKDDKKRALQLMELRSIQDWFIRPRLLGVKGVTEVNSIGGFEKQFLIHPNIKKMTKFGIHFDDISIALTQSNRNVGGGVVQQTGEQILVRSVGLLSGVKSIEDVVIKRLPNYEVIRVKDIATVRIDTDIRTGASSVNGEEAVIGTTFMLLGENSREVSMRVAEHLERIRQDLPEWVNVKTLYDRSKMVNETLSTVKHNLLMGAGLVILFLILLVGDLKAALITSIIIPISLLITFILMRWQNVSGNLMSLGALDFGIIVDGAVIVVERCVSMIRSHALEKGRDLSRDEVQSIVKKASIEIRSSAGFGELIVITAFIPLFALSGVEGKMFAPMAKTFIMALVSALVLSFTLVPALASTFLSGKKPSEKETWMTWLESKLKLLLGKVLLFKKSIIVFGIGLIIFGFSIFSQIGSEFIPLLDEGDFAIQLIRPANINIRSSVKMQRLTEDVIKEFPEVEHVFSRLGAAEVATDPMGVNIADCYIILKDKSDWREKFETKGELVKAIVHEVEINIPGQVAMATQPVELRFNELLEGAKAPLALKIFGDDLESMEKESEHATSLLKSIEGIGAVESESKGTAPLLEFKPKDDALAKLGVGKKSLLEAVEVAIGGQNVGRVYDGFSYYPVKMKLKEIERSDLSILKNLPVGISEGYTVPISDVAHLNFDKTYTSISRENSKRRMAVLINPETQDIESLIERATMKLNDELKLSVGHFYEWSGNYKNLVKAKERLMIIIPLALLMIVALLNAAFNNLKEVFLILCCTPMALIGGGASLYIMNIPFSISAAVGFLALSGISILNGVVLVSTFKKFQNEFNKSNQRDHKFRPSDKDNLIMGATAMRLRPVLMTALTDIFGFLPMMFSVGLGAEVQKPLATVVVGGMFSSTLLTLLLLPLAYRTFILTDE